jgi:hypothetical protein
MSKKRNHSNVGWARKPKRKRQDGDKETTMSHPTALVMGDENLNVEELRNDIAFLEHKLKRLSGADDSAYEKLLAKAYHSMLARRRAQLGARQGV